MTRTSKITRKCFLFMLSFNLQAHGIHVQWGVSNECCKYKYSKYIIKNLLMDHLKRI
ncbi:hypothetical protein AMTRI_Chr04g243300 [Amborella trichopoda]